MFVEQTRYIPLDIRSRALQADIEECIRSLGALDLLDAGALGKEVKRSDASSSSASAAVWIEGPVGL